MENAADSRASCDFRIASAGRSLSSAVMRVMRKCCSRGRTKQVATVACVKVRSTVMWVNRCEPTRGSEEEAAAASQP
eukprot:6176816-Pleurochrysis_carterae.AAC.2